MNKQNKIDIVDALQKSLSRHDGSFLVNVHGLTVGQMQLLRKMLRSHNSSLKIAKARLMCRAFDEIKAGDQIRYFLKDQVGLVFVEKDSSAVVKMLHDFSKEHIAFKLVAGFLKNKVFDTHDVIRIAQLPSREVLLARLCGVLVRPLGNFVSTMQAPLVGFTQVIKQITEIKSH